MKSTDKHIDSSESKKSRLTKDKELLKELEKRDKVLASMPSEERQEIERKRLLEVAISRANGDKIKDDAKLLKKSIKRQKKEKKKSYERAVEREKKFKKEKEMQFEKKMKKKSERQDKAATKLVKKALGKSKSK
ncbi:Surfeit locus 6 like protein [Aduncisulcus paluster]|nr:Surfeit locus 6 like protein [Aduncisulcus paluster]